MWEDVVGREWEYGEDNGGVSGVSGGGMGIRERK